MNKQKKTSLITLVGSAAIIAASKKNPWLIGFIGVFLLIFGAFIFIGLFSHPELIPEIIGILMCLGGLSEVGYLVGLSVTRKRFYFSAIVQALLYVLAGAVVLHDPMNLSGLTNLALGWVIVLLGIVRFYAAMGFKGAKGWLWMLLGGFILMILGLYIIAVSPVAGLFIMSVIIAVELIFNGILCAIYGIQAALDKNQD